MIGHGGNGRDMMETDSQALADVLDLLDLEQVEQDIFRGRSRKHRLARVFGGQVLGQALAAASRTVDPSRVCHSFHAYFLRPGDPRQPILYEVDRARDGRSFTARRVIAIQHGRQIFNFAASYHLAESGLEHQFEMPQVPPPEDLADEGAIRRREAETLASPLREWVGRARPFETRPVVLEPLEDRASRAPFDHIWFRPAGPVPDAPTVKQALLAYISDSSLLRTSLLPHGKGLLSAIQTASLDHAMWFHRPVTFDDWLLYAQDSPSSSGARGFSRGLIFSRDGELVASVAQEGLIRPRGGISNPP
jgi:acyl-CoA thioesterase-2